MPRELFINFLFVLRGQCQPYFRALIDALLFDLPIRSTYHHYTITDATQSILYDGCLELEWSKYNNTSLFQNFRNQVKFSLGWRGMTFKKKSFYFGAKWILMFETMIRGSNPVTHNQLFVIHKKKIHILEIIIPRKKKKTYRPIPGWAFITPWNRKCGPLLSVVFTRLIIIIISEIKQAVL